MKMTHHTEKSFTMIELWIVVSVLVIIAAVIVPYGDTSMSMGTVSAANSEAENVKTASLAYYTNTQIWPDTSSSTVTVGNTTCSLGHHYDGAATASYSFDDDGFLADAGNPRGDGAGGISTGYGSICLVPSSDTGQGKRVRDES
jgi:type II secretory pathway pseudopilin PulG